MLVACRLAGLSAFERHYPGPPALASSCGMRFNARRDPLLGSGPDLARKPGRHGASPRACPSLDPAARFPALRLMAQRPYARRPCAQFNTVFGFRCARPATAKTPTSL
jgi:hypothetical protein